MSIQAVNTLLSARLDILKSYALLRTCDSELHGKAIDAVSHELDENLQEISLIPSAMGDNYLNCQRETFTTNLTTRIANLDKDGKSLKADMAIRAQALQSSYSEIKFTNDMIDEACRNLRNMSLLVPAKEIKISTDGSKGKTADFDSLLDTRMELLTKHAVAHSMYDEMSDAVTTLSKRLAANAARMSSFVGEKAQIGAWAAQKENLDIAYKHEQRFIRTLNVDVLGSYANDLVREFGGEQPSDEMLNEVYEGLLAAGRKESQSGDVATNLDPDTTSKVVSLASRRRS